MISSSVYYTVSMYAYNYNTDIVNNVFINSYKNAKRKKKDLLPETTLVPQIEILKFYERAITARDFASILSDHISEMVGPDFNETDIHRLCWDLYFEVSGHTKMITINKIVGTLLYNILAV